MKTSAALLVVLLAACEIPTAVDAPAARAGLDSRPNVLFIVTDDQRYDDLPFMPLTLARMGAGGATFERAYSTTSWCCPARVTILRGQYAHNHGIKTNNPPLGGFDLIRHMGLEQSTIATWLHDAGYRTGLFGKYLNNYDVGDLADRAYIPPGWDRWMIPSGSYKPAKYSDNGVMRGIPAGTYVADFVTDQALSWITAETARGAPWFAWVAHRAPHLPATPADRHAGMFAALPVPRPPSWNVPLPFPTLPQAPMSAGAIASSDRIYRARLETLQAVDEGIAKMLDSLAVIAPNTVVIFVSDNGWMNGEHAIPEGKNLPFEESIHVPLLIAGPGVAPGARYQHLVGLQDIAPTIADFAGVAVPSSVDGVSLRALAAGAVPESSWRIALLHEHWRGPDGSVLVRGIRRVDRFYADWVSGGTHTREVHEMYADPFQLQNVYTAATPYNNLRQRYEAIRDCAGAGCFAAEAP